MLELIQYIVEQFAEKKDVIKYEQEETEDSINVTVYLADSDMGKVIGKQGRIAKAIRSVVKATSAKENKRVDVEII